ncbi:MAG: Uma2 family endonuclease [Okeania sp. SIO3B3]|nr:Uma2 family endonuclease [Okeania sp. SIO3B3]
MIKISANTPIKKDVIPPLESGDRLTRDEFVRRYEANPHIKNAELIEGVVYVASPVRHTQHGSPHGRMMGWLSLYVSETPGTDLSDNSTLHLENDNELQPDAVLFKEHGGGVWLSDGYLEGVPELVIEVAASSASYDMHDKRQLYARIGVSEYLVVLMYEHKVDWSVLRDGAYQPLAAEDGIIKSEVFPGLWLQADTLWSGNLKAMLDALRKGLASEEHAAFVAHLAETPQSPETD